MVLQPLQSTVELRPVFGPHARCCVDAACMLRVLRPQPLSVERAFRAVRRSEVAVLVLDASEGITQQDFRLAEYVVSHGCVRPSHGLREVKR